MTKDQFPLLHLDLSIMHFLLSALALCAISAQPLFAQTYRAQPSTRALSEVSLALADTAAQRAAGKPTLIRVDYGQPHLRGRSLHTGDLVPMGTVWRLGANAATLLTTEVDMTIGGKAVPQGRYVVQALPEASGWTLILQRETTGGESIMPTAYDASKDFARIPLTMRRLGVPVETLAIALVPSMAPGMQRGELHIMWGTTHLSADWTAR